MINLIKALSDDLLYDVLRVLIRKHHITIPMHFKYFSLDEKKVCIADKLMEVMGPERMRDMSKAFEIEFARKRIEWEEDMHEDAKTGKVRDFVKWMVDDRYWAAMCQALVVWYGDMFPPRR